MIHSEGSFTFLLCCTSASMLAFCFFVLFLCVQHIHRSSHTGTRTSVRLYVQTGADRQTDIPIKTLFHLPQVNLEGEDTRGYPHSHISFRTQGFSWNPRDPRHTYAPEAAGYRAGLYCWTVARRNTLQPDNDVCFVWRVYTFEHDYSKFHNTQRVLCHTLITPESWLHIFYSWSHWL